MLNKLKCKLGLHDRKVQHMDRWRRIHCKRCKWEQWQEKVVVRATVKPTITTRIVWQDTEKPRIYD